MVALSTGARGYDMEAPKSWSRECGVNNNIMRRSDLNGISLLRDIGLGCLVAFFLYLRNVGGPRPYGKDSISDLSPKYINTRRNMYIYIELDDRVKIP